MDNSVEAAILPIVYQYLKSKCNDVAEKFRKRVNVVSGRVFLVVGWVFSAKKSATYFLMLETRV